ncbi:hypothetical protein ACQRC4_03280 [Lachnospiraceae bacterium SGI.066]|mgnify:CR=1 FL=1
MKKIMTMADSVGQMNRFGKVPVWYYINGRQISKKVYQNTTRNTVIKQNI